MTMFCAQTATPVVFHGYLDLHRLLCAPVEFQSRSTLQPMHPAGTGIHLPNWTQSLLRLEGLDEKRQKLQFDIIEP